jgi:hypothetical protein
MSVAYVGSSGRLITDDEAFEQANDEVGIYEVRPVAIDPIDVPEPDGGADAESTADAPASAAPSSTESTDTATADPGPDEDRQQAGNGSSDEDQGTVDIPSATDDTDPGDSGTGSTATDQPSAQESAAASGASEPADDAGDAEAKSASTTEPEPATQSTESAEASPTRTDASSTSDDAGGSGPRESPDETHPAAGVSKSSSQDSGNASGQTDAASRDSSTTNTGNARSANSAAAEPEPTEPEPDVQDERSQSGGSAAGGGPTDLEVRSIPSLDPARSHAASKSTKKRQAGGRTGGGTQTSSRRSRSHQRSESAQQRSTETSAQPSADASSQPAGAQATQSSAAQQADQSAQSTPESDADAAGRSRQQAGGASGGADLEEELAARQQQIEDLRTDLERVEAERDELESARVELESERDRLQAELEEAQAEIDRLTERIDGFADEGNAAGTQLSAAEAIDNTNLFIRYKSKGDATLETAHAGNAGRAAVAENMRLEYHTQFDADDAAVGNEPFDDFLTGTIQYRFVDWLIGSLLYEVRDTGHADGMADLYNALPKIDRAELNGQVSVNYAEDGEEHRSQERFDVVVRDRMGNPLFVANINNSRDPATDAMMTDLVKRAERVGESGETLAGAFLVTESFFEPEALETAEGATSSGLFSRDKRKSFVNLSRKGGYHLCLVEARNQEFHLAVPEL